MKIFVILALVPLMVIANEVALQEFTNGNNLFTAAIYKEVLKENPGNFLVSPFSVQTVLALTQSGAKDETADEIRSVLHLPENKEKTEATFAALLPTFKGNEHYALHTANKVYVKKNYPLNPGFRNVATNIYQAGIENIDFTQKIQAADTINNWVEQQTNNKIHNLIDPKSLGDYTRLILVNALYFKGKWTYPFETYATTKKDFYKNNSEKIKVDTMHTTEMFNYYESPELDAKFLEMPYQGEDISMVIVLPNRKDGLGALENQIERVFTAPKFSLERVSVSLPKFTIENKVQMKKVLKNLGLKKVFTDEADLSGIAGRKGDLMISEVVQKAFINVTESGTEAAAATAVIGVDRIGFFGNPALVYEFYVEHPFLFYLVYKGQIIIFAGRVTAPQ